jgi:hypothetical protein
MFEFQKITVDSKEVEEKLKGTTLRMPSIAKKMMHAANRIVKKQAVANARSLYTKRNSKPDGRSFLRIGAFKDTASKTQDFTSFVSSRRFYTRFLEKGAEIKPRKGRYLHFKINGEWKTVSSVTIPAKPFLGPAVTAVWESEQSLQAMNTELQRQLTLYWQKQGA